MCVNCATATVIVNVHIEVEWGRRFNGEYLALTPGEGAYVSVQEDPQQRRGSPGFRGAPMGRCSVGGPSVDADTIEAAVEAAVRDFIRRGAPEWLGAQRLTRAMVVVTRTTDHRR